MTFRKILIFNIVLFSIAIIFVIVDKISTITFFGVHTFTLGCLFAGFDVIAAGFSAF
jgi:hypothetical protein